MLVKLSGAEPVGFSRVEVIAALDVFTLVTGNAKVAGESVGAVMVPEPVRDNVCIGFEPLSDKVIRAVANPTAVGVK